MEIFIAIGIVLGGGLLGSAVQNGLESIASAIRCYPHVKKNVEEERSVRG